MLFVDCCELISFFFFLRSFFFLFFSSVWILFSFSFYRVESVWIPASQPDRLHIGVLCVMIVAWPGRLHCIGHGLDFLPVVSVVPVVPRYAWAMALRYDVACLLCFQLACKLACQPVYLLVWLTDWMTKWLLQYWYWSVLVSFGIQVEKFFDIFVPFFCFFSLFWFL